MKVDDTAAEVIVGFAALVGMGFFIWAGRLSDRIGRKKPIVWGYGVTLVLLFPLFWWMGSVGNPALSAAAERAPVTVTGSQCSFDPFAQNQARSEEHTSELQSLMRISYAVFCLKKKKHTLD